VTGQLAWSKPIADGWPLCSLLRLPLNCATIVKVILFDFDGTIADSFELIFRIANRLAVEYGYPTTNPEDIRHLKNLTSKEVVRQSGVNIWQLLFLLRRLRREMNREIATLKLIPGMRESLSALKDQGHWLGIVTSNSTENVETFLQQQQLGDLFDQVVSGLTLFGKGKVIRRVIQQHQLELEQVIYVGDETRDIEAAHKVGVVAIAVSWGFSSSEVLAKQKPDYLVHHPEELVNVIRHLA